MLLAERMFGSLSVAGAQPARCSCALSCLARGLTPAGSTACSRGSVIPWFNHARYAQVRNEILNWFTAPRSRLVSFTGSPTVVFVCGAADNPSSISRSRKSTCRRISSFFRTERSKRKSSRALLEEYFRATQPKLLTFRAETAWAVIEEEFQGDNALVHEAKLAECSDAVIIIVESVGTAAELGAFAISDVLRKKLLLVLRTEFQSDRSFINLGPVRWADADSIYKPAIYTDLADVATLSKVVADRLITKKRSRLHSLTWKTSGTLSPKELLFVLAKLVFVLGSVPRSQLNYFLKKVFGYDDDKEVAYSLSLACALGLATCTTLPGYPSPFFWCHKESMLHAAVTKREFAALNRMRGRALDPLRQIDVYRNIDHQIRSIHAAGNA